MFYVNDCVNLANWCLFDGRLLCFPNLFKQFFFVYFILQISSPLIIYQINTNIRHIHVKNTQQIMVIAPLKKEWETKKERWFLLSVNFFLLFFLLQIKISHLLLKRVYFKEKWTERMKWNKKKQSGFGV